MKKRTKRVCTVCVLLVICTSASASVTITPQDGTQPAPGQPVWYGTTDTRLDQSDSDENKVGYSGSTIYIVPEPATLSLLVIGGAGVLLVARRRLAHP